MKLLKLKTDMQIISFSHQKKGVPATPENLNKLRQKGEKKLKDEEKEVKKSPRT